MVEGGYNNNGGELLSNESYTPQNGLWHLGITANLGKGLFIDKRRAELQQAKIYQKSTMITQKLMLNQF